MLAQGARQHREHVGPRRRLPRHRPRNAAYSSTKGAIASLTKELACEWGKNGIRVNAVAPCWFHTEMNATSIFANQCFMEQVVTKLPMGRIGTTARIRRAGRVSGQRGVVDDHRADPPGRRRRRRHLSHRMEARIDDVSMLTIHGTQQLDRHEAFWQCRAVDRPLIRPWRSG